MLKLNWTAMLMIGALQVSFNAGRIFAKGAQDGAKKAVPAVGAEAKSPKGSEKPKAHVHKARPKTFDSGAKLKSPYAGRKSMAEKVNAKKQDPARKASQIAFEKKLDAEAVSALKSEKERMEKAVKEAIARSNQPSDRNPIGAVKK